MAPGAIAGSPSRKTIGLKATKRGAAGVATITRISFSEDDDGNGPDEARVSVRYGPKPRRDKKGMTIGPWPDTSDLRVPAKVARTLSVGSKCRITLEPVGSGYDAEERAEGE